MKTKINYILPVLLFWMISTNQIYAQDDWTQKFPTVSFTPVFSHSTAYIGGDKVVTFGGLVGYDNDQGSDETWVYDLSDNMWTLKNPAVKPPGRYFCKMAYIGGDKVLLTGGYNGGIYLPQIYHMDTWVYDLSDNTWTNMNPPVSPGVSGANHGCMDYAGDDKVVLVGVGKTWVYDLSDNIWTLKATDATPGFTQGDNVAYIGDDKILLSGVGLNVPSTDTWIYDLSDNTWTLKAPTSAPSFRYYTVTAYLGDDRVLLQGGLAFTDGGLDDVSDTWMYDLSEDTWILLSTSNVPGTYGQQPTAMDHIGSNKALLNGGGTSTGFDQTWLFTGSGLLCGQELCNGEDDDCDGLVDEGVSSIYFLDADDDGYGSASSSIQACEPLTGYVGNGTDCDDTHASMHPDAAEIADGFDNDCDGMIDEGLSTLSVTAGDCETVYYGYAPAQCKTLTATASGGATPYTFLWSNGANTATTTVCPTSTTNYTVSVTDYNGFTAHDVVTVQVVDVRCGSDNSKVTICHVASGNGAPVILCVAPSAVAAHLSHGDQLGSCITTNPCGNQQNNYAMMIAHDPIKPNESNQSLSATSSAKDEEAGGVWNIYPNPTDDQMYIEKVGNKEVVEISLFDISGKMIKHQWMNGAIGNINMSDVTNGIYFLKIISTTGTNIKSVMVQH